MLPVGAEEVGTAPGTSLLLLILFPSYGNLVLLQIHLPNNSRNWSSVSEPEAQTSTFWAQEHASQHRRGFQSHESQGRLDEQRVVIKRK